MCGRFEIHSTIEIIARIFQIDSITFDIKSSYNVAPSQEISIVINDGQNRLIPCRWGFVPSWSKELKTGYAMINARAETVATNKTFKHSFESRRCLVVADGFYEWKKEGAVKTPFYIHLKSGQPFGFAGLYNIRTSPEGETMYTCTIITTVANEALAPIHDRMPVIERPDNYQQWLDPHSLDPDTAYSYLQPIPAQELEVYPVTPKVNSFKYNQPGNIKRI